MRKNKGKSRLKTAEKVVRITLVSLVSLVIVVVAAAGLYVNSLLDKVDYDHDDPTVESSQYETDTHGNIIIPGETTAGSGAVNTNPGSEPDDLTDGEEPIPSLDDDEAGKVADDAKDAIVDDTPVMSSKDVVNILLIGVDARTAGQVTNSDAMILVSINKAKKKITMSSLMRDMYVAIPGVGNTKLNHANSIGGPSLLLKTVQQNFKIDVSEYVMVDFYSMARIVDILGGVTVSVTDAEVPHINSSVRMTNEKLGLPSNQGLLAGAGTANLTGAQAVGYSRIRYVGNADFGRTQRQRTVMTAIFNKVKGSSIGTLNNLAQAIMPQIKTNIPKDKLLGYMTLVPQAAGYPITQLQIPASGQFSFGTIGGLSYLIPDITANRNTLHNNIY